MSGAFAKIYLHGDSKSVTNICTLPLISGSPTDWSNLRSALKVTEDMLNFVTENQKAIVSLDLQLYSKCIQLQEQDEINRNYIFRMGELHVVFTVLKVLGKMIDGSGLDQSLEEAGIYGNTTMCQIKDGKHLHRALEAHFILYLSLYQKYISKMLETNSDVKTSLKDTVNKFTSIETGNFNVKKAHDEIKRVLLSSKFDNIQYLFDQALTNQAKFFRNYMKLFETLLLFIRASRQQNWSLHLASLHNLAKYFFANEMLNYARLTPVYLAQIYKLERSNETIWNFFVLGADHALEQANRTLKVHGGIKGIANNQSSLDQYFIIAPELSNIIEEF